MTYVSRYFCFFLALLIVSLLSAGCGSDNEGAKSGKDGAHEAVKAAACRAVKKNLPEIRAFTGNIRARVSVELASKLPGNISAVPVETGDKVRAGDVVVRVDDTQIRSEISSLKASIRGVQDEKRAVAASYGYAKSNFERIKKLFREEAATRDEFDRAESKFTNLQSRMAALDERATSLKAGLKAAWNQLSYLVIKSPVNGSVVRRNVDPGTYVNPGVPLIIIDSMDDGNWFEAGIDSALLEIVKPGMQVTLVFPQRNLSIKANIAKVSRRIMEGNQAFSILVDPGDAKLSSGEFGRVYISTGSVEKTLIPSASVIDRGGLKGVFVINKEGFAEWRVIRTGQKWFCRDAENGCMPYVSVPGKEEESSAFVEALAGIEPGEKIIVSNLDSVKEGCRIE